MKSIITFTDREILSVLKTSLITLQEKSCKVYRRLRYHEGSPKMGSFLSFLTNSWTLSINRNDRERKETWSKCFGSRKEEVYR